MPGSIVVFKTLLDKHLQGMEIYGSHAGRGD